MKITEAMLCVNRLPCNHCEGFGTVYLLPVRKKGKYGIESDEEKCSICAGEGDYECGELVHRDTTVCPSCTGKTFLVLDQLTSKDTWIRSEMERDKHLTAPENPSLVTHPLLTKKGS